MKKRSVALIITVMVILSACSTIHFTFNTKINTVRTTILANHLFKKNGNAFYLTTTWSPISVVWTYKGTKMEVFRLWRGSIRNKQSFVVDNITGYIDKGLEDAKEELYHTCPMCLDGDGFDYLILTDSGPYEAGYSLDIGDLKTVSFSSPILKKLQKDINTFGLWDYWVNQNDNGRANVKSKDYIQELTEKANNASSRRERERLLNKIRNIKRDAQKKAKGEEHSRSNKR